MILHVGTELIVTSSSKINKAVPVAQTSDQVM